MALSSLQTTGTRIIDEILDTTGKSLYSPALRVKLALHMIDSVCGKGKGHVFLRKEGKNKIK